MMISTQTICMCACSPVIPQPGIRINSPVPLVFPLRRRGDRLKLSSSSFRKGRGSSTLAIKQASSSFSSAEDASADEVPAKNIGVSDLTGTKPTVELVDSISPAQLASTVELVDAISPAQLASTVDDQLPPLLSMIIDGLPPLQQSKYVHDAENLLRQYVDRYPTISSLASYCQAGLCATTYAHPGVISLDRTVAMSINYALLFVLDDLFFDIRSEILLDQYGVGRSTCESPETIEEYVGHLGAVLSQQVQPRNPTPLIETMMRELGRNLLERSNPEWFRKYVEYFLDCQRACIASEADIVQGRTLYFQDLESYTVMRAANVAGKLTQVMTEFANDSYIPGILRADPYFENITTAVSIHIGFVNDVFSYHRESTVEQNPRNLITVLMECEGKPFLQAAQKAIGLVNTYARAVIDLEAEAWNSTLLNYLVGIKAVMAGNIYFCLADKRYHHPDSAFPELRDMTSSWKIVPLVKAQGL